MSAMRKVVRVSGSPLLRSSRAVAATVGYSTVLLHSTTTWFGEYHSTLLLTLFLLSTVLEYYLVWLNFTPGNVMRNLICDN